MSDEIKEIKVNKANKSITFINNGIAFSQFGVADEILDLITNLQQENDRLNNIINELEDIIVVKLQRDYYEHDYRITTGDLEEIYDRLKELKENNRE